MSYDFSSSTPTLEGFIEFLKQKPLEEKFFYLDSKGCAAAQYCSSIGAIYYTPYYKDTSENERSERELIEQACANIKKSTFGNALNKAIELQQRRESARVSHLLEQDQTRI